MAGKRGRPRKAPGEGRDEGFYVRLTMAELHAIRQSARRAGFSVSAWIRWRAVEGVRAPS